MSGSGWKPTVAFHELVEMMVDNDLALLRAARDRPDEASRSPPGRPARTAATWPSVLLDEDRQAHGLVASPATVTPASPTARGTSSIKLREGDLVLTRHAAYRPPVRRAAGAATSPTDARPGRVQLRRRLAGTGRAGRRRRPTGLGAGAPDARSRLRMLRDRAAVVGATGSARRRASEMFGLRGAASRSTEATPTAAAQSPYGAAEGARASTSSVVYRESLRAASPCSGILYNHESPRRPAAGSSPARSPARRRAIAWAGETRPAHPGLPQTPAATGAGRRTTSTRWCAPPATTSPATT